MASPQIEDGFTQFANDIVDAMARLVLNSGESRCLWFIWRKTYGWHKKTDKVSLSQFTEATGMGAGHICEALASLKERNIIEVRQAGHSKAYSFQKDYSQWDTKGKQGRRGALNASFLSKGQSSLNTEYSVNTETKEPEDSVNRERQLSVNTETQKKGKKRVTTKEILGRDAPAPTVLKQNKQKAPPDPRTNVVMNRIQTEYGRPILHWPSHASEVKKMLAAGYTDDQIFNCWKAMRDEKKGWVRLSWVAEDIGDFVENGEKRPQRGTSNRPQNVSRDIHTDGDYAYERSLKKRPVAVTQ